MTNTLYDDEYTGPRYTYGFRLRPFGYAHQPRGFIHGSNKPHPLYRWGTLDYPAKLDEKDAYQFDLVLLEEVLPTVENEFAKARG